MSKPHGPSVVLVAAAVLAAAGLARAQRESTERHVFVRVTDARDAAVAGLTAKDFVVREDDVAREIVRVGAAPPPSHVVLLADNTSEAQSLLVELRSSLLAFVLRMTEQPSPPAMALHTFAERPTRLVDFTTSDIALENGIKRIFPRPASGSHLLDAIVETSEALGRAGATRPAIVAFVMDSSPEFSNRRHEQVAKTLEAAGASLWAVELQRGAPAGSLDARERAAVVTDVTTWSGGMTRTVLSRQALERAFTDLAAAMLSRYDVTYGRPSALIPPSRLTVEARDRTLRVSAPRWAGE
jgi:hypothetical protein